MKPIKKRASLGLILLLIISLLVVGCGSTNTKPSATPSATPSASNDKKADQFPTQNINGIIAWGAGGGTDNTSRTIAPLAEKILGKSIIMSNKTGASGAIATQYVADQPADGYNLLFNAENPQLYQILGLSKLSYNDFEPIILMVQGSTVIVVPKNSPYKTLDDLINDAKANPGKITIGNSGVGGQPYVTAAILNKVEQGVKFNQVSYDGDGPLVTALLGNQVQATGLAIGAAAQYIKNGDLRPLALMSDKPNPAVPEAKPITEIKPAYKDILKASGFFYGVWVKKGTPEDVIKKLTDAFSQAFKDPKFQEFYTKNGFMPMGLTGQEAKNFAKEWQSQMAWLIYDAGGAKESPEKFGIPKPAK